jgi:GNAT superfamily N-acetyltransferase
VTEDLVVRPARAADRRDILVLFQLVLGWVNDARHEALFAWKHDDNVFGISPSWVACDGDRIVGFRTFLRWEFEREGAVVRAVRAVDTATDPEYQRRGVFRQLTLHALEELRADGADLVFNTPNDRSRPGYLSMGWQVAGRIPLAARPGTVGGLLRLVRARVPADVWPAEWTAGDPAAAVLEDEEALSELLRSQPRSRAMVTRRSVKYLRWRYGFEPLGYRAVVTRGDASAGVALFRVRQRGAAREAVLCDVLVPEGDARREKRLVRAVLAKTGADYLLRVARHDDGCVPLPRQGPVLTWRSLRASQPSRRHDWDLTLGDVELF